MDIQSLPTAVPNRPRQTKLALQRFVLACFDAQSDQVRVVQVGANDGRLDDPISAYWPKDYWSGVLIEPHPLYFSDLEKRHGANPNLKLVNAAVSEKEGKFTLYHLDENLRSEGPGWLRGCASLDKQRMISSIEMANRRLKATLPHSAVVGTDVVARRLDHILSDLEIATADLLVIDVEGHEVPVLKSVDLPGLGVKLAIVESNSGNKEEEREIVSILNSAGLVTFKVAADIVAIKPGSIKIPIEAMFHFNNFVPLKVDDASQPT